MGRETRGHGSDEGRVVFRELQSVEAARAKWYAAYPPRPVGQEEVALEASLGRVVSADVVSPIDVPPFDRAVMDGFAVVAADTFGSQEDKPRRLKIVGRIQAGDAPDLALGTGRAAEIATGAVVPKGANAVAMVEYSRTEGSVVDVFRPVAPGENVFPAGADVMAGETVVRRGAVLSPREIGVLAAIGRKLVTVWKRPRVAILSTGNELADPGGRLMPGKIYDINASSVAAAVREAGGDPVISGIAPDDADLLLEALKEAHRHADLTIVSGGTSAGAGDLLYRVLDKVGPPGVLVHGVAVRPGKPTILAASYNKPLLGLPGYPTSALMIFRLFGAPLVRVMAGLAPNDPRSARTRAVLAETVQAGGGRREFQPVGLVPSKGKGYTAFALPAESGAITTLAEADGFFEIPEGTKMVAGGDEVEVELFGESLRPADLVIAGSHCLGIDYLLELAAGQRPSLRPKVLAIGSTGGLSAVGRGEADIAGIHLLHPETGSYNVWAVEARKLEGKAVLVRGYARNQVLVIRPGGTRRVTSIADLLSGKFSFINRNPGSGTRALVEAKLKELARDRGLRLEDLAGKIPGWEIEAKSHAAVATAVAAGRADAGVCVETAAVRAGLARIPLAEESFDFLVRLDRMDAPPVEAFLAALGSPEFARDLAKRVPGLRADGDSGAVVWPREGAARTAKRRP